MELEPIFQIEGIDVYNATTRADIDEIIESGINNFYALGSTVIAGADKTSDQPLTVLWKIRNSPFALSIKAVNPKAIDHTTTINQRCQMNLPKIPLYLVQKMDVWFRKMYAVHKTESILVLLYDMSYLDSEDPALGWGATAPQQENTAGNCKYDPSSIVDALTDEHVLMVGSVHSHPNMPAYASTTDHTDQADFDGLHITYGWDAGTKIGETSYHAEITYGGTTWIFKPEDVMNFSLAYPTFSDDELKDWSDNVSEKKFHQGTSTNSNWQQHMGWAGSSGATGYGSNPGALTKYAPRVYTTTSSQYQDKVRALMSVENLAYPADIPDPKENVIVAVIDETERLCLHCTATILDIELVLHRCFGCGQAITLASSPVADMNEHRAAIGAKPYVIYDVNESQYPIILWTQTGDENSYSADQRVVANLSLP